VIADQLRLGEQVAREHDGPAALAEVADELADLDDAGRVEAVGGLIEEHEIGLAEQRAGDPEPLLHAE